MKATVRLYNPYHDSLGRFTTGPTSSALFGVGSSNGDSGRSIIKTASSILDRTESRLYGGTTDPKIVPSTSWDEVQKKTGIKNKSFLGAFISDINEVVISPSGIAEVRRNPKLLDRIISHEAVHSRQRSRGRPIQFENATHAYFEEGLADLISLSPANNRVGYNYQASPYYKQMQSVARAARQSSNNDPSRAWQWITQSHYYNDNPNVYRNRYRGIDIFRGTGTSSDIEWLFGSTPRRLEEEDDIEELIKRSEIQKWKALGIELEL